MPVQIKYEADLSAVRKAIADLVAESSRQSIHIPVSAAGFAPGAPGTTGGIPTASGVFAGSRDMVAGRFGALDRMTIPGFAAPFAPAGGFPGVLGDSFAFQGVTPQFAGSSATFAGRGPNAQAALAGVPGGGGAGIAPAGGPPSANVIFNSYQNAAYQQWINQQWNQQFQPLQPQNPPVPGGGGGGRGRLPYGLGGLIGLGTAFHVGFTAANAVRQEAIDTGLATDQRGIVEAQLAARERIAHSGGFIGQAIAWLQDPTGSAELGIRSTLQSSEIQDKRTDLARRSTDFTNQIRDARSVLTAGGSAYERRLAEAGVARDVRTREINARLSDEAKLDAAALATLQGELSGTVESRVGGVPYSVRAREAFGDTGAVARYEATVLNPRRQSILAADADRVGKARDTFNRARDKLGEKLRGESGGLYDDQVREAGRIETLRLMDQSVGFEVERTVAGLQKSNAPNSDIDLARVRGEGAQLLLAGFAANKGLGPLFDIARVTGERISAVQAVAQRELKYDTEDAQGRRAVSDAILGRDPLEARLRQNYAAEQKALRDPRATEGSDFRRSIESDFANERAVIRQEDADERRYRKSFLQAEERELRSDIDDRPIAGRLRHRADSAVLQAQKLREQEDDAGAANQVIKNAILEQKADERQILRQFRGVQVGINEAGFGGPGQGMEDLKELLASIDKNIALLSQQVTTDGGLTGTTTD